MRRLLLAADIVGLTAAFLFAMAVAPSTAAVGDRVSSAAELALFAASLPFWVVLARVHTLVRPRRGAERPFHRRRHLRRLPGRDDRNVVVLRRHALTGLPHPTMTRMVVFWLAAIAVVPLLRAGAAASGEGRRPMSRTSSSSAPARLLGLSIARSSTTASTASGWLVLSTATTAHARARKTWS